jgi:hypothetical protein
MLSSYDSEEGWVARGSTLGRWELKALAVALSHIGPLAKGFATTLI